MHAPACRAWRSPIVQDGKVVIARATACASSVARERGRRHDLPDRSTGKAITAAALAVLVDEGKIGWDDKVIDHMPWFRMYDPWVTQ
jgi:CubicO group peptidase (beta-lactamase class C family)